MELKTLEWISSLDHGRAVLLVELPDGKIAPQDAQDILDWFDVVSLRLRRLAASKPLTASPASNSLYKQDASELPAQPDGECG